MTWGMDGSQMAGDWTILAINPGSTSTKVAVYRGETLLLEEEVRHTAQQETRSRTSPGPGTGSGNRRKRSGALSIDADSSRTIACMDRSS